MNKAEMEQRGWDALDVLLLSGDSYVDHPAFGMAVVGRWLEHLGLRVGIVAQPCCDNISDIVALGRPRLFVGVGSGTVDSMLNNYTANRKPRSDDAYAAGGKGGRRPDRAATVYSRLAREAFPQTPLLLGGVEGSLRRLAHFDFWDHRVRPSILADVDVDLLLFGMAETALTRVVEEFKIAQEDCPGGYLERDLSAVNAALCRLRAERGVAYRVPREDARDLSPCLKIPSFEEVRDDKRKFAKTALFIERETNPHNAKRLIQYHGRTAVVVNPPPWPLTQEEYDAVAALPYTRDPHPSYTERIPAAEMIRFSVCAMRGCFAGCSFCAITLHQGRIVQTRSAESLAQELKAVIALPDFTGHVSDLGGPTANMYGVGCRSLEIQKLCRKVSCLFPKPCPHLQTDHGPQRLLLKRLRAIPGIKQIRIASGIRYDLALADKRNGKGYLRDVIAHHVGGQLKVAPEHLDEEVLRLMKKPAAACFDDFVTFFKRTTAEVGKEQYLVPYFISGFPGSTPERMRRVHDYLAARSWNVQQVQAFIPTPMTMATAMYWTGLDPETQTELYVARSGEERRLQQALLQPFREKNRRALQRQSSTGECSGRRPAGSRRGRKQSKRGGRS